MSKEPNQDQSPRPDTWPIGCFIMKDITRGETFKLSNGAELTLATNADGYWLFSGSVGGATQTIAFTPEACEVILGAMIFNRDHARPVMRVELPVRNRRNEK